MEHSFNVFLAKKYGVNAAIFIKNMVMWIQTNAAKNHNYHDGRYWAFGTPEYFQKYFIYFTPRQIKYLLEKCTKEGLLQKANYNKKGYDRTSWYTLTDKCLVELNLDRSCLQTAENLIRQNCPSHKTKLSNASDKIVRPIPDTKPDTKPDKYICSSGDEREIKNEPHQTLNQPYPTPNRNESTSAFEQYLEQIESKELSEMTLFDQFWALWPKKEGKAPAQKVFNKLKINNETFKKIAHDIEKREAYGYFKQKQFIPMPATYLNQHRWEDELTPCVINQSVEKPKFDDDDMSWGTLDKFENDPFSDMPELLKKLKEQK